jgi:hypothetical protein
MLRHFAEGYSLEKRCRLAVPYLAYSFRVAELAYNCRMALADEVLRPIPSRK